MSVEEGEKVRHQCRMMHERAGERGRERRRVREGGREREGEREGG